ncbi:MAG: 3-dehydroquinate synthase [Clostridia bacterium]
MKTMHVKTGREYDIHFERGALQKCGKLIRSVTAARRAAIITDSNVAGFYAAEVRASLTAAGFEASLFVFPAGEESKTLATIADMLSFLAEQSLTRGDIVVALGGGVTGDMAGFAASCYLRGIEFIQIPTSLLAQIDSSVGGKTGVDLPQGKNLCGAFHQPALVIIDPDTLETLPAKFFTDGMGEAVKYGCIKSPSLFERIENEHVHDFLDDMIYECVDIKRIVVENDEKEKGERMLLNFGHTLGHALEKYYHFTHLTHGQAVGIGMVLIAHAGERNGITAPGTARRIVEVLRRLGLPHTDPAPLPDLLRAAHADKKRASDGLNLVLLREIGSAFVQKVPEEELPSFFGCKTAEGNNG